FHGLLEAFYRLTGCPVLVNTSFNVRGEPIVCTPQDAYRCFLATDMDALVLEDCVLLKRELATAAAADGREADLAQFQLDRPPRPTHALGRHPVPPAGEDAAAVRRPVDAVFRGTRRLAGAAPRGLGGGRRPGRGGRHCRAVGADRPPAHPAAVRRPDG